MAEAEHGRTKEALWVQIATHGISAAWTVMQQSAGRSSCISWWVHHPLPSVRIWHSCWFTQASWKGTRLHCLCCPVKMFDILLLLPIRTSQPLWSRRNSAPGQVFIWKPKICSSVYFRHSMAFVDKCLWLYRSGVGSCVCLCVPMCGSHVRMGALVLQWSGGASLHHLSWFSVSIVGYALPALVLHPPVPENCSGMWVSRALGYHWGCTDCCCNGDEWNMITVVLIITL